MSCNDNSLINIRNGEADLRYGSFIGSADTRTKSETSQARAHTGGVCGLLEKGAFRFCYGLIG